MAKQHRPPKRSRLRRITLANMGRKGGTLYGVKYQRGQRERQMKQKGGIFNDLFGIADMDKLVNTFVSGASKAMNSAVNTAKKGGRKRQKKGGLFFFQPAMFESQNDFKKRRKGYKTAFESFMTAAIKAGETIAKGK